MNSEKERREIMQLYEVLADLLEYPQKNWVLLLEPGKKLLLEEASEIEALFEGFCLQVQDLSLAELQEKYTQTFDLTPACTLEVGYHLFGENYKRGLFLAELHETEAPFHLGQEHQLPDYLPVLLRLMVKLEDEELRTDLANECVIPAIEKMIQAVPGTDNPFGILLKVVLAVLNFNKIIHPEFYPQVTLERGHYV